VYAATHPRPLFFSRRALRVRIGSGEFADFCVLVSSRDPHLGPWSTLNFLSSLHAPSESIVSAKSIASTLPIGVLPNASEGSAFYLSFFAASTLSSFYSVNSVPSGPSVLNSSEAAPPKTPPVTPLHAALTHHPASGASKRLTPNLNPLEATLTRNRGGGPTSPLPYFLSSVIFPETTPRLPTP
jgi:hypothetical protein